MLKPHYSTSLFIFRRDLRLHDNTALLQALSQSGCVLPCFIFDPRQIQPHPYQSQPALQFMLASLLGLDQSLQKYGVNLASYQGLPADIIKRLVEKFAIQAVFVNRDYTPFSRQRDYEVSQLCRELKLDFISCGDSLLTEPEDVLKPDRTPYKVFTAFYNCARQQRINFPEAVQSINFIHHDSAKLCAIVPLISTTRQIDKIISGGSQAGLAILDNLTKYAEYKTIRDIPSLDATSKLSVHLKFGTLSVRQVYYAIKSSLGDDHPLLRQLYWRDFFTHIAYHFPYVFGKAFNRQYDKLPWHNNQAHFKRWCDGLTGFPIVDAGMRELKATGFMHNRVRMIVASFLVKDLHISWRWGERYFAQHLVDYDPAVNNGNWQWAASTGCDAQPYFRIFNPWLQQVKFDPEAIYIKRWLPELQEAPIDILQNWYKKYSDKFGYPASMLDHAIESKIAKENYRQLSVGEKHN